MPEPQANGAATPAPAPAVNPSLPAFDDFGLPIKSFPVDSSGTTTPDGTKAADGKTKAEGKKEEPAKAPESSLKPADDNERPITAGTASESDDAEFKDAHSEIDPESSVVSPTRDTTSPTPPEEGLPKSDSVATLKPKEEPKQPAGDDKASAPAAGTSIDTEPAKKSLEHKLEDIKDQPGPESKDETATEATKPRASHNRDTSKASIATSVEVSEFSHQPLSVQPEETVGDVDGGWQEMPAFARFDMYDDDDKLIARERNEEEDQKDTYGYGNLGGAGRGYTRVGMDEDAQSATSMDENTKYLFKDAGGTNLDDEDARDAMDQMQATKDLLTEGQRVAYVGIVRLEIAKLVKEGDSIELIKKAKKEVTLSAEALRMWGQKMMIRVYSHMDISEAEQVMIEQLAEHGVQPSDLTPTLLANSRVHNPMAASRPESRASKDGEKSSSSPVLPDDELPADAPPPYQAEDSQVVPAVQTPAELPTTQKIDIDLRWTVLCDLFLLLIADSVYDARSRVLLERVGASLNVEWLDICRFEKRITDALEMQQQAEKENWNEDEHMEERRKKALKKRYVMMGLATVGGGLVIGLSAGLLAPVIGAGLAAGFTTIGVGGTSSFLAGAGGAAIITSSAAASGSLIGVRAANRRTGAVKTFEYRPLHNNKRVNLVVTVSGWLTGKMDDVRLPFSTVDPIMGDIYSILWEPEMLTSMGDTINILATEALTQGLQQILGQTILISLMAALQLPLVLTKLSYLIDNPWAVSLDRAMSAGLILADSIIERSLGTRPITLVGYSLGSRVIFSCLQELARKGAYGLVQDVYLFGSPVVVRKEEYLRARTVVSGRFVNGFNRNDWILGYLFRLTNGGIRRVAGLAPLDELPWIENMDVTEMVKGHMDYRKAMPSLLKKCGWTVTSEEFSEIEDPDPENHQERQRELINEIEEARKEAEEKEKTATKSSKFSLFGRRKKERQEWEVYEEQAGAEASSSAGKETADKANSSVLFDIDAIRTELAMEAIRVKEEENGEGKSYAEAADDDDASKRFQIREIQTTLPPMKLDLSPVSPSSSATTPVARLAKNSDKRGTQSSDALPMRSVSEAIPQKSTLHPDIGGYHLDAGFAEEEIQMTFDTSFDDASPEIYGNKTGSHSEGALESSTSGQTLANMKIDDPWADAGDDDEFKHEEGEISMTFA